MRLVISSTWVVLVCLQTFQVNAQDFITKWHFTNDAMELNFYAVTQDGPVNYSWTSSPSGISGSGSFTQTTPDVLVTMSGMNIPANNIVTINMAPTNLRRFYNLDNSGNSNPDALLMIAVDQWGAVPWTSMYGAFAYTAINSFPSTVPNLANVTDFTQMFLYAESFNQPLNNWDVSNVNNMYSMFAYATTFNQPINNWSVSNVTDMSYMFIAASSFNQDIGNWVFRSDVNFSFLFNLSGMDCNHYTATLVGWQANNPTVTGRALGAQGRQYGTSAVAARNALINNRGWTITGDNSSGATCDALLPIGLNSFIVSSKENEVDLHWQTSSEINNNYFDIEYSTDGTYFTTIGRYEGAGNCNTKLDYHFVHQNVKSGIHYYRLKQVDYDGQFSYSDIKSVIVKCEGSDVSIYPNPAQDLVSVIGIEGGSYTILDPMGREMLIGKLDDGLISLDGLPKCTYVIKIVS